MPRADESSLADRDAAPAEITVILNRALAGDAASREQVYALLYAELVRLARSHLAGSGAVSLNPSALVHEAYLRMLRRDGTPMRDRRAFFAYASTVMRSVLITTVANSLRISSPAGWPKRSLIDLKWSMSKISTVTGRP